MKLQSCITAAEDRHVSIVIEPKESLANKNFVFSFNGVALVKAGVLLKLLVANLAKNNSISIPASSVKQNTLVLPDSKKSKSLDITPLNWVGE